MLALKAEAGRKDRLLHLLATISVGIEKRSQFDWDQAVSHFGWQPHCVFATSEPLSNQKEAVKRVFLNLKILILWEELLNDFPYWSDSGQPQQKSPFYIIDKGTYHNEDTRISKCYKKRVCVLVWLRLYWLKEMLLSPLLDIARFRCAGRSCWEKWCLRRDRENSRKKLPVEQ